MERAYFTARAIQFVVGDKTARRTWAALRDPSIVLDLLQAFRCSKAIFAAASVGVFDALVAGPKTLNDIVGAHLFSRSGQ